MQLDENSIKRYNLSEEDIKITMSGYQPKAIPANQYFLKEGEICGYIGFVKKGLLRAYFYDDKANEITTQFYPEDSLVIAFESFNMQVPSKEYIKALEDTELLVIPYENQKELYVKVPVWNQICKELSDSNTQTMLERSRQFQVLSASERYQMFCKEHPGLLQRVALGHIASYIGVDIATLSRIRKKW